MKKVMIPNFETKIIPAVSTYAGGFNDVDERELEYRAFVYTLWRECDARVEMITTSVAEKQAPARRN